MITLQTLGSDDWQLWRELRLQALREAPHAFSATIEYWAGEGDVEERWRERLTDGTV